MVRLFTKPVKKVVQDTFEAPKELVKLNPAYEQRKKELEADFQARKLSLEAQLRVIENSIEIKRSKREEAEVPITERIKVAEERERKVLLREEEVARNQQQAFEQERKAETKLEDVQILSDQLGETRVRQMVKEQTLEVREKVVRQNENRVLLGIDALNKRQIEVQAGLSLREEAVTLRELDIQSKEENLVTREKELSDGHIWLNDQRGVLARAWAELKRKQNVKSNRPSRKSP